MIDINEKANNIITKTFNPIFTGRVDAKLLSIVSIAFTLITFFLIVSKLYFYAGVFSVLSLITSTSNISLSDDKKSYVLALISNLAKFIILTLAVLTVILNLELHKIALFFIIYLLLIGAISFVSKEYIKSIFNVEKETKINPSVLVDSLLTLFLFLSVIPFLQNSIIIIFIILSSVLNTYLLVSDVLSLLNNKESVDEIIIDENVDGDTIKEEETLNENEELEDVK